MLLTRQEIVEKYPNQWVGINNIQYTDNTMAEIKCAEVVYTGKTASELGRMALRGEDIVPFYTTPDEVFQLGAIGGIK